MNPQIARLAGVLAIAAVAVAGCGGEPVRHAPAAQQAAELTRAEAFARADRVAEVVALGSRVVEGAPGTPFTRTELRTKKVLKGTLRRRFAVQVIGARLHSTVVSSPVQQFRRSHRYLVFLGPDGPATCRPDPRSGPGACARWRTSTAAG